ncbi:hypothetical protein SS05631_c18830 [Sinorhizobium sp. CCBAU 05631]|nr:hypothetical protein SS05631_c18830 [Sinorhizobium sp. CCBAU 05631]
MNASLGSTLALSKAIQGREAAIRHLAHSTSAPSNLNAWVLA